MLNKFTYIPADSILAKFHRDLRGTDISESDAIEWIGEALGFLKVAPMLEEAVAFVEVENHHIDLPAGLQYVVQIARNNNWTKEETDLCPQCIIDDCTPEEETVTTSCSESTPVVEDCQGKLIGTTEAVYYRPFFDLQYEYLGWTRSKYYGENYTPVRLANHTFFNSLVCKETDSSLYGDCQGCDEYTLVNDRVRFSFKEGSVAIAYLRTPVDKETGFPMVPDHESFRAAVFYYMKWKIAEWLDWNGREGFARKAQDAERQWYKYRKQAKSAALMPTGIDQHQNLMEQSRYLIPRLNRYYGFFGKLGRKENRNFNDPDHSRRYATYRGYYRGYN